MPKSTKISTAAVIALVVAGILGTVIGLLIGRAAEPPTLVDPGPVVRWGLPIVKALFDLSLATALGSLVYAAFSFGDGSRELQRTLNVTAAAAASWSLFGFVHLLFTFSNVSGTPVSLDNTFGANLWMFVTQIELGKYLALNLLAAALLTVCALAVSSLSWLVGLIAIAFAGLVPLALTGHAAGTANHGMAVNSIGMHLVGVSIWIGGLVTVVGVGVAAVGEHIRRYSTLALLSFALVAVSGIASAWIRVGEWKNLFSAYGVLILLKTAGLVVLGLFGANYRGRLRKRVAAGQTTGIAVRLVIAELVVMGATAGIAAALARTAPPVEQGVINPTPAQMLTGEPLPPELTALRWLTAYRIDLLWLAIAAFAIGAYLYGVRRLAKRGDKWPVGRTISWIAGMLTLIWVTSGSINAYQEYLFSAHMIGHMILAMVIPVLLVPGAPVTLISRATEKRHDDSRGLREWVLWAVHTKYAQFIANPIVAAILFASSLVTFYYTPLFAWATREHIGHEWMVVHFVITGYLFTQALVGIDPGPVRLPFAVRLMLLIVTMAFHAFFGLSLMSGNGMLLADWYGAMGRTWGEPPLADQQTGGAIAWGIGEIPTALLTIMVSVQWARSDQKEAKRLDRASDRTGGADIDEYNEMLAKLASREVKRGDR
ncbi:MAG: bifunctional copper resistance protein CopD/cytochrome c oxidase assembly protein [Actinomycetales bacterium]|nr:bifunctional copper resistance protein CopD/cytochrome c oxidase assembly protein [Actinomycetales bacterium]